MSNVLDCRSCTHAYRRNGFEHDEHKANSHVALHAAACTDLLMLRSQAGCASLNGFAFARQHSL